MKAAILFTRATLQSRELAVDQWIQNNRAPFDHVVAVHGANSSFVAICFTGAEIPDHNFPETAFEMAKTRAAYSQVVDLSAKSAPTHQHEVASACKLSFVD